MRKVVIGLILLASAGAAQAVTVVPDASRPVITAAKSPPIILVPEYGNLPSPVPDVLPLATVPEPSTWALLAAGFGIVGYGLRRRKNGIAAVEA